MTHFCHNVFAILALRMIEVVTLPTFGLQISNLFKITGSKNSSPPRIFIMLITANWLACWADIF